jgi:hypothetical protein
MVEGAAGALCIDCVAPTVRAFEGADSFTLSHRVLMDVLAGANPLAPFERSRALVDATALLSAGDADALREVSRQALRLSLYEESIAILERIAERTPVDEVSIAHACWRLGRTQAGLSRLAALDPLALGAHGRILYLLNHAALTLDAEPAPSEKLLDDLRSRLEEARMLALALPDKDQARHYLAGVCEGLAAVALRAKDARRAIDSLEDARKHLELGPSALILLGDAHAACGDDKAAHAAWMDAIKRAHPETRDAQLARKRLTGVYR